MINIGCHLSSSGGFLAMGKHATELGADTFAFFTRNPRGGSAKEARYQGILSKCLEGRYKAHGICAGQLL